MGLRASSSQRLPAGIQPCYTWPSLMDFSSRILVDTSMTCTLKLLHSVHLQNQTIKWLMPSSIARLSNIQGFVDHSCCSFCAWVAEPGETHHYNDPSGSWLPWNLSFVQRKIFETSSTFYTVEPVMGRILPSPWHSLEAPFF